MTVSRGGPTNLTKQAALMYTTLLQPHNHQFMELIILSFIISILLIKTWSGFLSKSHHPTSIAPSQGRIVCRPLYLLLARPSSSLPHKFPN